jgi:hypothetical protein
MKVAFKLLPATALIAACASSTDMRPMAGEADLPLAAFDLSQEQVAAALAAIPPIPGAAPIEQEVIEDTVADGTVVRTVYPDRSTSLFLLSSGMVWRGRLNLGTEQNCNGPIDAATAQAFVRAFAPTATSRQVEAVATLLIDEADPFPSVRLPGVEFAAARGCIDSLIASAR